MHNFKKLKVYQRAIDFAVEIYQVSKIFPKDELFGLTNQIRRAVTSVSLNIAEGSGNKSNKEFQRFLEIALRSDYEVMTCLEIALKLKYCKKDDYEKLITESDEIAAMIVGFSKNLSSRKRKPDI
ncbi:MAG: four helix bundle protein [Candidatus Kuenenia sp.]|nr:four helix bundle protein [Candidatus Kuenenia hertensis]